MRQINLMVLCEGLKPGQCINIPDHEMRDAAAGSIKSALLDGPPRADDVVRFVGKIRNNWGVQVTQRVMAGEWVICRPRTENSMGE